MIVLAVIYVRVTTPRNPVPGGSFRPRRQKGAIR
jgi:hypothetical protein